MKTADIKAMVRKFQENGIQATFDNVDNVRDFLNIVVPKLLPRISFDDATILKTGFISARFQKTEADFILRATLLDEQGQPTGKTIYIYILVEHQSEPDEFMRFRMLLYVVQILLEQMRQYQQARRKEGKKGRLTGFLFHPVLPIIFYTGKAKWDSLPELADLTEGGVEVSGWLPSIEPEFIRLSEVSARTLKKQGKHFGSVLRLMQEMKSPPEQLQAALGELIETL